MSEQCTLHVPPYFQLTGVTGKELDIKNTAEHVNLTPQIWCKTY